MKLYMSSYIAMFALGFGSKGHPSFVLLGEYLDKCCLLHANSSGQGLGLFCRKNIFFGQNALEILFIR